MYVTSDPRSQLAPSKEPAPSGGRIAPACYYDFSDAGTAVEEDGALVWYGRGHNFIAVYAETRPGAVLERKDQPDEYTLLLPESGHGAVIDWDGSRTEVAGGSIVFIPAGDSRVTLERGGTAIRLMTTRAADLVTRCRISHPHYEEDTNVPPLEDWPAPPAGPAVRAYTLDVASAEGRFGRIFRSTTFMVNYIYARQGPRDRSQLSPHKHDRFQQGSLCLEGTYVHHLRWPWTTDADEWRDDDHVTCGPPSLAVIPAGALHTSEAVGQGRNMLVDIFCPPREDFSKQPGWVLNADDYPHAPGGAA